MHATGPRVHSGSANAQHEERARPCSAQYARGARAQYARTLRAWALPARATRTRVRAPFARERGASLACASGQRALCARGQSDLNDNEVLAIDWIILNRVQVVVSQTVHGSSCPQTFLMVLDKIHVMRQATFMAISQPLARVAPHHVLKSRLVHMRRAALGVCVLSASLL